MTQSKVGRPTRVHGSLTASLAGTLLGAIVVIDGDTVEQDGHRWRIAGIDAPEIHKAKCPEERRRGILGAARLIALIEEHGGRLEALHGPRKGKPLVDQYRRTIGHLYIGDRLWADIAIAEGHAVAWDGRSTQPTWCEPPA